jgi:hypothetical protein
MFGMQRIAGMCELLQLRGENLGGLNICGWRTNNQTLHLHASAPPRLVSIEAIPLCRLVGTTPDSAFNEMVKLNHIHFAILFASLLPVQFQFVNV